MAVRVLLVEDNEVYRSTLELLLDGRDGIEIAGSVADGRDAAAAARAARSRRRPDGLPAARASTAPRRPRPCARALPRAAILCLTAEATDDDREAVLAAGAAGLIEKGRPTDELVQAILRRNRVREHVP